MHSRPNRHKGKEMVLVFEERKRNEYPTGENSAGGYVAKSEDILIIRFFLRFSRIEENVTR